MASEEPNPSPRRRRSRPATSGTLKNHLSGRVDPLTSAILVFPLFIIYQLGILTSRGQNGVDFVTSALVQLSERDLANYMVVLAGMLIGYAAILVILRNRGHFTPRAFFPVLLESLFYATTMGTLITFAMRSMVDFVPGLAIGGNNDFLDTVVISAGAGFHEELIFRALGVGGLAWLLTGVTGKKRAWLLAVVLSSLVFSLAHHIGPHGEAFTFAAFVYRSLAGLFFALVYQVRGFAVAVWTHTLYDVFVFTFA